MSWFNKKPDLISDRARVLNAEIASLEAQIKKLDERLQRQQNQPRLRSTAVPHGAAVPHSVPGDPFVAPLDHGKGSEPIFEEFDQNRLEPNGEPEATPDHYNDLGVRKYDLPALFRRVKTHFQAPSTTNPKLVSYLAAGGIQGLRPLRYEKRVARNRFIALVIFLFVVLLGLLAVYVKR